MVITFNFKDSSKTITFAEIEAAEKGSDFTDFGAPKNSFAYANEFFYPSRRLGISPTQSVVSHQAAGIHADA